MNSKDVTFTSFTPGQAAAYVSARGSSYPRALYSHILEYHSGGHNIVYDVGTGPGQVLFHMLEWFLKGLGCDTSVQMIEEAKKWAGRLNVSERTAFTVSGGETCADAFPTEQVDLMTVAMAVHWFDLPAFFASAAKILRPGGTLALWTCSSQYVHPSTPNHREIQDVLFRLEDDMLAPFRTPGNAISRNAYKDLSFPWDFADTRHLFQQASLERIDWDLDGGPSAPAQATGSPGPFILDDGKPTTVQSFLDAVGSASMVIRWRDANPQAAQTEDDPVHITAKALRSLVGEDDVLRVSPSLSLLLMRRS